MERIEAMRLSLNYLERLRRRIRIRRSEYELDRLPDYLLRDIGLDRTVPVTRVSRSTD
ncbi:hypothetical protein LAB1_51220 [Roseibium sp. LAB1]